MPKIDYTRKAIKVYIDTPDIASSAYGDMVNDHEYCGTVKQDDLERYCIVTVDAEHADDRDSALDTIAEIVKEYTDDD